MTKSKLWHIILMVGGTLAVLAPDLTGLAASLAGMGIGWLNWVARVLGVLALIGSRWDVIRGKLAPLLIEDRTKLEPPSSSAPVVCILALVLGSLLLAGQAQAQPRTVQALGCIDAANTYCVVPAAAVGWQINLKTGGAGKVTFAPVDGDVTITPAATLSISAQDKGCTLIKVSTNGWRIIGSLIA